MIVLNTGTVALEGPASDFSCSLLSRRYGCFGRESGLGS